MRQVTRLFDFPYYQLDNNPLDIMMSSQVDGKWKSYSTAEFIEVMNDLSKGLIELGVEPGDKIALISHNNRCEWNLLDQAILQVGAINVPVYPTMTENDYEYIFNHAKVKHCFVSNNELYLKVKNVSPKVESFEKIYTFENVANASNWKEVIELGRKRDQSEVDARAEKVKAEDLATIIYTSGTTGLPKGVMLSHNNIVSNSVTSTDRLPDTSLVENYRVLSFLPISHIFERMLHYLYMYNSASIYFAESLETIKEDLNYSKPHMFTAVPRLLEKFFEGIVNKGQEAGGIKTKLFNWAVDLALAWEPDRANGGMYEFKLKIARKLVFSKVKFALGLTEIQAVASGSAALQARLARFFNGAGIPVFEGYGLTETSPVITVNTLNQAGMLRIGSVGKPIRDVEVKIASDGEILCKGPNVMMGYYNDPVKTAEVLKDGWFHTGDIGEIDKDGFLKITDRKKEIFKTSGGKYVAPQIIENALKESKFIEQCIVLGEGQKHASALIVPSFDSLKTWCSSCGVNYTTDAEMIKNSDVKECLQNEIDKINTRFAKWEQVKQCRFLGELFSIEKGELTPTLKLKRKNIYKNYDDVIQSIYGS